MAQLAELETALINADKAGDADGARMLAGEIVRMRGSQPLQEQSKPNIAMAIPTGINTLLPSILGLPMDTARNVANLGIAAYGTAKGALGSKDLPDVIPPQPLGSEWFAKKISGALGEDVFSNPRPDSTAAELLHTGSGLALGIRAPKFDSVSKGIEKVSKAFRRDKLSPADAMKQLDELGPEATITDIGGENVKALARSTASLPGPGKEVAARVLNERQFGQSARVSGHVSESLGSGELFYHNVDDLLSARKAISGPLYEKAVKGSNLVPLKDFAPIKRDEFIMQIVEKVKSDPLYKLGGMPDNAMPIVDATKKYIDRMISSAKRGNNPNNYEVSKLVEKTNKLKDVADNAFPVYKRARDAFAGPSELIDALQEGRAFIKGDAEATKATLAKLSQSEQEFFRIGAARALRDKVLGTSDTADTVKKIFNTPLIREKLQVVFPTSAEFSAFEKMMNTESTLFKTRSDVLSGSRTAPLQAEMADTVSNAADWGRIGLDIANLRLGSAGLGIARKMKTPESFSPETSQELAKLLFSKGDAGKDALQTILSGMSPKLQSTSDRVGLQRSMLGLMLGIKDYQDPATRKNDDSKAKTKALASILSSRQ